MLLEFIRANPELSSKEIHDGLGIDWAYATIKRAIQKLVSENLIAVNGKGKSTKYKISDAYNLFYPINIDVAQNV